MDLAELKRTCVQVMEASEAVYLTTLGDDEYPRTRAMLNLRNKQQYPGQVRLFAEHQSDLMIYLSTNTSSSKVRQLKASSHGCAYYCVPSEFKGVMLAGDVEIVDESEVRRALWNEGWERYYPGGPDDPDHTVLRLYPRFVEGWWDSRRVAFRLEDR